MRCKVTLWAIRAVAFVVCASQSVALADDPPLTRTISFQIREEPNSYSQVLYTIDLQLTAEEVDGSEIGWTVNSVTIAELDEYEANVRVWVDAMVEPDTPDKLWWIEHADTEDPELSEFTTLPSLVGTAIAEDPNDPNMAYSLEGVLYDPPGGGPFEVTTALDYSLTLGGSPTAISEGEDVLTEILPKDQPPAG